MNLAEFLEVERGPIGERFRAASSRSCAERLPEWLDALIGALRSPTETASAPASDDDLEAALGELALLRDCVLQRLEVKGIAPSPSALRTLLAAFAGIEAGVVHARRAATDSEHRDLLSAFQGTPGFVAILRGPEHVFELANAAYSQLVGHRALLGKSVRAALPEVATQGFPELLDRVYQSGEPFLGKGLKISLQSTPGGPLHDAFLDFVYQPLFSGHGEINGILVQGYDVTASKRNEELRLAAEEAVRVSEERFRTLFEHIDDGYCLMQMLFDEQGSCVDYVFLEVNATFERHTGLVHAKGKRAKELVPDLGDTWPRLYGEVATTGTPARFENEEPAMDGRWFEVYANRVGRPELRQVALVFKDISVRKKLELEQKQRLELEQQARASAEEAGRLKDEFLATLSHELRTPLHSMAGWVSLLRTAELPPERRERALATIARNVDSQARLIDDLLDVSRILAGKMRLEVVPLDVHGVIDAALDTVRPTAEAKSIRLHATLATGCVVMGDPGRLQQVVWNLLSNAVKFTARGGRVQVVLSSNDSSVEIAVCDTGKGIAADFLPYVFERFRQESGGASRVHGGLGLGLAIVRQIAELHGGTVRVESAGEGQGASFFVRLPLAIVRSARGSTTTASEPARSTQEYPRELRGLRLLIVDDDQDSRDMLQATLEQGGCLVRSAGSAQELRALLREELPDLILSDIGMPEEDGYSLIQQVRRLPPEEGGRVPAVAITAYARSEDRAHALRAGFDNHVTKPVDSDELFAVLAALSQRFSR
ncbi:MAG: ATP-binding protein [Polyangiales bacterium]